MTGYQNLIVEAARENRLLLFVGAGASMGEPDEKGLPTGWGLGQILKQSFAEEEVDLSLEKLAEFLEAKYGRNPVITKVSDVISAVEKPVRTHHLLAEMANRIVVTTNYDDLLEKSLSAAGKEHVKITSDFDLINLDQNAIKVFKIHGCINTPSDDYILTEKDYYEKFLLSAKLYVDLLKSWLTTHTCLFIGYGLHDVNLKHLFFEISGRLTVEQTKGRYFAVQFKPAPEEVTVWEKRGFHIVDRDQNAFLEELVDGMEFYALERTDGKLVASTPIRIGKMGLRELRGLVNHTGKDEQRVVMLSRRKMDYLKVEDGDWISIEANHRIEWARCFAGNRAADPDLKLPLVMRNLLGLEVEHEIETTCTLQKVEVTPLDVVRLRPHDMVATLPLEEHFDTDDIPRLALRNLMMGRLGVKAGDELSLVLGDDAPIAVRLTTFISNPGRAVIGVDLSLKDHIDEALQTGRSVEIRKV